MIGILDYGMGNLGSVQNTCAWLGLETRLVARPAELSGIDALIVPGQGAFRDCMRHMNEHGFVDPLREWIEADRPVLGICMGLQLLFEGSEESPGVPGLGILPGVVARFPTAAGLKIPQMGWNRVSWCVEQDPVFSPELQNRHFYFVHSYHVPMVQADWVAGCSSYGGDYVSAVRTRNCRAVQFHPEKSQKDGVRLLRNFAVEAGQAVREVSS